MNRKRILLVEDDFSTQYLFTECLKTENYDVFPMDHGRVALEHMSVHGVPDLVLMDLSSHFITPEAFVHGLRKLPQGHETPIIVVSGKENIDEEAKNLQVSAFLRKPCDLDPLLTKISQTI